MNVNLDVALFGTQSSVPPNGGGSVLAYMAHVTTLKVRFNELDPYGHVNHSVYATYCEIGRTEALEDANISLERLAAEGYQMVVTHLDMSFLMAAEGGDTLTIETSITKLRRASGTWSQRVCRGGDVLLTAEVTAAVTDASGKPTKPPAWLFPELETIGA